jgi:hypothetical protein
MTGAARPIGRAEGDVLDPGTTTGVRGLDRRSLTEAVGDARVWLESLDAVTRRSLGLPRTPLRRVGAAEENRPSP